MRDAAILTTKIIESEEKKRMVRRKFQILRRVLYIIFVVRTICLIYRIFVYIKYHKTQTDEYTIH